MCGRYAVQFLFILNQSTAFEVRISDWSSDGGSSGLNHLVQLRLRPGVLAAVGRHHVGAAVAEQLPGQRQTGVGRGPAQRLPAALLVLVTQSVLHRWRPVAGLQPVLARVRQLRVQHRAVFPTGRASTRESVSRYVLIMVGLESLKKTKKTIHA